MAGKALQTADIYNVIVGTAGHIDHGKSTLVRKLTGIDPDRLPEEKEREMTIDLGFAPFMLKNGQRVGIIDVPGHERFVKNMVAGSTSIDVVLFVVAGDDGIMPQTREHLQIMNLLNLKRGIVVMTKADVADPEMADLVAEEIREMTKGTFLEDAPHVRVSSVTGAGFDTLIDLINKFVMETPPPDTSGIFRMPIQRIFSAKGFGTVITGVPVSGKLKVGDTIEILPLGRSVRVRSLQAYKCDVPEIRAGHSSALAVTDVEVAEINRGDAAATPGYFKALPYFDAELNYLMENRRPLKHLTPVRVNVGTKEAVGRVAILDKREMQAGERAFVQIRCDEPIVVGAGDRFILRLQSPVITIGGGRVLTPDETRQRRFGEAVPEIFIERQSAMDDPRRRVEVELKAGGKTLYDVAELAKAAKQPPDYVKGVVEELRAGKQLREFRHGKFMHLSAFEEVGEGLLAHVERFHRQHPLKAGIPKLELAREAALADELFAAELEALAAAKKLAEENGRFKLTGFEPKLSRDDAEAARVVEQIIYDGRYAAPSKEELFGKVKFTKDRAQRVLDVLADRGAVLLLKDGVLLHKDRMEEARKMVVDEIKKAGGIDPARAKDLLGTSRKFVIPILERFDEMGVTVRVENKRLLKKEA